MRIRMVEKKQNIIVFFSLLRYFFWFTISVCLAVNKWKNGGNEAIEKKPPKVIPSEI